MIWLSPEKPSLFGFPIFFNWIFLFPNFHSLLQGLKSFPVKTKIIIFSALIPYLYPEIHKKCCYLWYHKIALTKQVHITIIIQLKGKNILKSKEKLYLESVSCPCKLHLCRNPSIPCTPLAKIKRLRKAKTRKIDKSLLALVQWLFSEEGIIKKFFPVFLIW